MAEKWQKALAKWDAWNKSINECRAMVDAKYGDFGKLVIKRARIETRIKKKSSTYQSLSITGNEEAKILWDLYDEISEIASRFITEQIGLPITTLPYRRFRRCWLNSAFPEIIDRMPPEILEEMPIRFKQTVKKEHDGNRVVYSISWYPNRIFQSEVAQFVSSLEPFINEEQILKRVKGGRRSLSKWKLHPEAIVCAILHDQQKLPYKQIADFFGWKYQTNEDKYLTVSNTVANRVKLGRCILAKYKSNN